MLWDVCHDLVPLPLVDESHVLAVGAEADVEILVVVVEEVQLDHLVVPEAPHRHVGALGVQPGLLRVGAGMREKQGSIAHPNRESSRCWLADFEIFWLFHILLKQLKMS